jgi:hypothetical protein
VVNVFSPVNVFIFTSPADTHHAGIASLNPAPGAVALFGFFFSYFYLF